ncbi:retrovirus-related pol polyprotein from transposon TNT 1-94 [Tanacetum coccineum]|uniref:Retrovirus-related pol polyprotein from transposon TNT 1-94 n=1 Tax=Tanacetum coccineum TaxID=301880 RepID=A0ABQ5BZ14_9ASTR
MDLCGPMRIQSINGRKYILVIVDDYSRFTCVKFLRSNDEFLAFVIKFLKMIQVCLNATVRNIRTDNVGKEFVNQHKKRIIVRTGIIFIKEDVVNPLIKHLMLVTPQQNVVVEKTEPYFVEACRTNVISQMLIFSYLWEEALATAALPKTIFYSPNNYSEISSGTGPQLLTPGTINSGLVPQPPSLTSNVPPTKDDWDVLFQLMFDEFFKPPPSVDHPVPPVAIKEPDVSTGTPSSTTIAQDAPFTSTLQTTQESQSQVIPPSVEEEYHDIEVAHMDNDPYFGLSIPKPSFEESSSLIVVPTNVHSVNQPPEHIRK